MISRVRNPPTACSQSSQFEIPSKGHPSQPKNFVDDEIL
jgi:hypothetical protein